MSKLKIKMGTRGQIVIPKVVRESIGLKDHQNVLLEVKDNFLEIKPVQERKDILERWEKISKENKTGMKNIVYGDKLYEEVF